MARDESLTFPQAPGPQAPRGASAVATAALHRPSAGPAPDDSAGIRQPGRPLVTVFGPTASGKSALALAVAEAFGGTVINADSMQVYRDLRILTARPSERDEARAPHRLYGFCPPDRPFSVAEWLDAARAEIRTAWDCGRLPIVVGGTGLYLEALTRGLSPIPDIDPGLRAEIRGLAEAEGAAGLYARLAEADPAMAGRLKSGDRQRLARALEVVRQTGRSLAEWQALPPVPPLPEARIAGLLLLPERAALYAAINQRLRRMVAEGALEEVRAVMDLDPALPAMKALGLPELARHLNGAIGLEDAVLQAQQASRRYAKRQITWARHRTAPNLRLDAQYSECLASGIFSFIRCFLLTEDI